MAVFYVWTEMRYHKTVIGWPSRVSIKGFKTMKFSADGMSVAFRSCRARMLICNRRGQTVTVLCVAIAALLVSLPAGKIAAANRSAEKPKEVKIWPGKPPGQSTDRKEHIRPANDDVIRLTDVSSPTVTVFRPANATGPVPAVLICPGGGYQILAMNKEGTDIAKWLSSIGLTGIVLKYRVPKNRDGAFQDVQRAMRLVRQHADQWEIDADRIGVMGFSAGGHLAASLSTRSATPAYSPVDAADKQSCKPDFTILIYPAYLGTKNYELTEGISISSATPPTFLVQTQDDKRYVNSSIAYYLGLKKADVPAELHLFPHGGHGFGLRASNHAVSQWPRLCEAWLRELAVLPNNKQQ